MKKLQESTKQSESVINKQKDELKKIRSELQEMEANKRAIEKKHETLLQSNVWFFDLHF